MICNNSARDDSINYKRPGLIITIIYNLVNYCKSKTIHSSKKITANSTNINYYTNSMSNSYIMPTLTSNMAIKIIRQSIFNQSFETKKTSQSIHSKGSDECLIGTWYALFRA